MRVITQPKELIGNYVASKMGRVCRWGSFEAVGLLSDLDELAAGAVFNGYDHPNILMHIAAERMTPGFVAALMHYPFVQLNCERVTGLIDASNRKSIKFALHLGAAYEGSMMRAAKDGGAVRIYGLLREEGEKWLDPRYTRKLAEVT